MSQHGGKNEFDATIHRNRQGKPRVYCGSRAGGLGCTSKGTFLEVYEAQIQWYLENFIIPEDYREKILEAHRKLEKAYLRAFQTINLTGGVLTAHSE